MPDNFADRLIEAIRRTRTPACVGIDPLVDALPPSLIPASPTPAAELAAIRTFCLGVIEAVATIVPVVKINIAFFEPYRAGGIQLYDDLVAAAQSAGLIVIGDIKRGDIGHSTTQYARAHLGDGRASSTTADEQPFADAVTVSPYLGSDGIDPFMAPARTHGRGVFALVQTSNPAAARLQGLELKPGGTVSDAVGGLVAEWAGADGLIGAGGYSALGAVVSPRDVPSTRRLRAAMPRCIFLVPGFGAQGRSVDEVATCFNPDGLGAIVNASRSVIFAFKGKPATDGWQAHVRDGAREFVAQLELMGKKGVREEGSEGRKKGDMN